MLQDTWKHHTREVISFDGRSLDLSKLIPTLESQSLFDQEKAVVIDRLHKNKSPKNLKAIIDYLGVIPLPQATSIVLWEDQLLTPAKVKKFGSWKTEAFKTSKSTFVFLDSLSPSFTHWQLYTQAVASDTIDYVFACLCNQVRSLLVASDNPAKVMPPWKQKQLVRQAQSIGLEQLLSLHAKLLELDMKRKSGGLLGDFETALQLALIAWVAGLA